MSIKEFLEGKVSLEQLNSVDDINYSVDGLGSISRNKRADLTIWTSPIKYLQAVLDFQPDQDSIGFITNHIQQGKSIAPPNLKLVWVDEVSKWWVRGHEGRHRMKTIENLFSGVVDVPCHVETRYRENADDRSRQISGSDISQTMIDELDNAVVTEDTKPRYLDDDLMRKERDITDHIEKGVSVEPTP